MKGNKLDFHLAMGPDTSKTVYEKFLQMVRKEYQEAKIKGENLFFDHSYYAAWPTFVIPAVRCNTSENPNDSQVVWYRHPIEMLNRNEDIKNQDMAK